MRGEGGKNRGGSKKISHRKDNGLKRVMESRPKKRVSLCSKGGRGLTANVENRKNEKQGERDR